MMYILNCKGIRLIAETFQLNACGEHNQFSNCCPRHSIGWFFVEFLRVWALLLLVFGAQCMYSLPPHCKGKTVSISPKGLRAEHCWFLLERWERILWKERGGSPLLQECCCRWEKSWDSSATGSNGVPAGSRFFPLAVQSYQLTKTAMQHSDAERYLAAHCCAVLYNLQGALQSRSRSRLQGEPVILQICILGRWKRGDGGRGCMMAWGWGCTGWPLR